MKLPTLRKLLVKSVWISAVLAAVYLAVSMALIFWPSSPPFDVSGHQANRHLGGGTANTKDSSDIEIPVRDGEKMAARLLGSDAQSLIILM